MKAIYILLAFCIVAIQAGLVPHNEPNEPNEETEVKSILDELKEMSIEAARALEHQVEVIVLEPLQQLDEAVQSIDARKEDSEECVNAEEEAINRVVEQMNADMNACGLIAAKDSAEIAKDVSDASQQLVFDGYALLNTYERCRKYTNPILQNSCYAKFTIQATIYITNARRSIKTIKQSYNERIPAVAAQSNECTHTAADVALLEFANAHDRIDSCIIQAH